MSVPNYLIRHISIQGFIDEQHFLNHLFASKPYKTGMLVAINAEKVLTIEDNAAYRQLIDQAAFRYADGISIVRAIRRKYPQAILSRIAGADFWQSMMAYAGKERIPVFLLGGTAEVLQQTKEKVTAQWQTPIVGTQDGYFTQQQQSQVIAAIEQSGAQIITVAMGSPRQEQFILACQQQYPNAIYMGVGGTYDAFIGRVKRAPQCWQALGLEWLYRLVKQPGRLKRQWRLWRFLSYYYRRDL